MKNNRGTQLDQTTVDLNNLSTESPAPDSLFWKMWNANTEIAQAALNTDFVQGIKNGNLNPQTYGAFNVSDAYYCFHGSEDYQNAADRATHPVLKAFLQKKRDSYVSYNDTFPETWRVKNGDSIVPTEVCQQYSDYERSVCSDQDPIYALIVMLPCEYLWGWLGAQLVGFESGNLYADWIKDNQGTSGAFAMGNFIEEYRKNKPIDEDLAMYIYNQAITFEKENFAKT